MEINDTPTSPLSEIIADLAAVRDFLADHSDLPEVTSATFSTVSLWLHRFDERWTGNQDERDRQCRAEFARCARLLMAGAPVGSIKKESSEVAQTVSRSFGKIKLSIHTSRAAVCERRVIGVEKVQVPDPTAPTVEVEREIVEWVCAPILPAERLEQVPA